MKTEMHGFEIIELKDHVTRECVRFFSDGGMKAVLQKNGKVAVWRFRLHYGNLTSGEQLRVAKCLHGLKLIDNATLAPYLADEAARRLATDVESLHYEAERLGYKVTKLKPAKRSP